VNNNELLVIASKFRESSVIELLIQNGANIKEKNEVLVSNVSESNNIEMLELLINNCLDIKERNDLLISNAVEFNNIKMLKLLINNGANVKIPTKNKEIKLLMSEDLRCNMSCSSSSMIVNEPIINALKKENIEIVELLITNGVDISNINIHLDCNSVLRNSTLKLIKLMTNYGAKFTVNECVINHYFDRNLEVVQLLLDNCTDINLFNKGPIINAASTGQLEIVRLLINRGINLKVSGDKAIIEAAYNDHLNVVRLLVENGVNINVLDKNTINKLTRKSNKQ
jgi:ankyrin repeat protein